MKIYHLIWFLQLPHLHWLRHHSKVQLLDHHLLQLLSIFNLNYLILFLQSLLPPHHFGWISMEWHLIQLLALVLILLVTVFLQSAKFVISRDWSSVLSDFSRYLIWFLQSLQQWLHQVQLLDHYLLRLLVFLVSQVSSLLLLSHQHSKVQLHFQELVLDQLQPIYRLELWLFPPSVSFWQRPSLQGDLLLLQQGGLLQLWQAEPFQLPQRLWLLPILLRLEPQLYPPSVFSFFRLSLQDDLLQLQQAALCQPLQPLWQVALIQLLQRPPLQGDLLQF